MRLLSFRRQESVFGGVHEVGRPTFKNGNEVQARPLIKVAEIALGFLRSEIHDYSPAEVATMLEEAIDREKGTTPKSALDVIEERASKWDTMF